MWELDSLVSALSSFWDTFSNRTPSICGVYIYHAQIFIFCSHFVPIELWYVCCGISEFNYFQCIIQFIIQIWYKLQNIYMASMYLKKKRVRWHSGLVWGRCSVRVSPRAPIILFFFFFFSFKVSPGECWDSTSMKPRSLPCKYFSVHHSSIITSYDAVKSIALTTA